MSAVEVTAKARMLVRRPCEEVFDAFADPEIMSKFWFTRRDGGLREGDKTSWFIGKAADAPEIEVHVRSIKRPSQIVIDWGHDGSFTTVSWTFQEDQPTTTRLEIEEAGFSGQPHETVTQALDSMGGFNQMIVALKALLEHGATINVVDDHV